MENKRQNNVDSISVLSSYLILNNYFNVFYSQFCHLKNGAINSSVIALEIMITWIYSAHNTQYFINLIIYTRLFQKILWYFMEVFPVLVSFPHKAALRARNWVQKAYLGSNTRKFKWDSKERQEGRTVNKNCINEQENPLWDQSCWETSERPCRTHLRILCWEIGKLKYLPTDSHLSVN